MQVEDSAALWILTCCMVCWEEVEAAPGASAALQSQRLMPLWHMMQQAGGRLLLQGRLAPADATRHQLPHCLSRLPRAVPATLPRFEAIAQLLRDVAANGRSSLQRAAALTAIAGLMAALHAAVVDASAGRSQAACLSDSIVGWLVPACNCSTGVTHNEQWGPAVPLPARRAALGAAMVRDAAVQVLLGAHQVLCDKRSRSRCIKWHALNQTAYSRSGGMLSV